MSQLPLLTNTDQFQLQKQNRSGSNLKLSEGVTNFVAGAAAGAAATIFTYPLDLLRTRFALQGNTVVYKSIMQAVSSIYRTENGLLGFYKGLGPALLQIVPYMGIMFQAYNRTRDGLNYWLSGVEHSAFAAGKGNAWVDFVAGGSAGLVSKLAVMPVGSGMRRGWFGSCELTSFAYSLTRFGSDCSVNFQRDTNSQLPTSRNTWAVSFPRRERLFDTKDFPDSTRAPFPVCSKLFPILLLHLPRTNSSSVSWSTDTHDKAM